MTHVIVTGKTWDHRERLKELGGMWNPTNKHWQFDYADARKIEKLKQLVGCIVVDVKPDLNIPQPAPTPQPEDDDDGEDNDDFDDDLPWMPIEAGDHEPVTRNGSTTVYGDDERFLNYFKDKNPVSFFGFSSLSKMVKFIEEISPMKRGGDRDAGWKPGSDTGWHGTRNMGAAIDLARNGWAEGIRNAAEVLEIFNVEHAVSRRRAHSLAGSNVNVGRMLAGNPLHMLKRPKRPGRRVVTLFVENVASSYIKAHTLIVRAAVVAALADIMEANGYSCEIVSVTMQKGGTRPAAQTAVTLKHAGEKLNLDDLVFALGHPSFLRRFGFACVSQANELQFIWDTQGQPTQAFNGYYPHGRNEFYIRHLTRNYSGSLREMAYGMLPSVKPERLPIKLKEIEL